MSNVIAKRTYTISDQKNFAELTGDFNPIHLDEIRARRELAGDIIVHGIHTVLWALDAYATRMTRNRARTVSLVKLTASFPNPAYLHREVKLHTEAEKDNSAVLEIKDENKHLVSIIIEWKEAIGTSNFIPDSIIQNKCQNPRELSINEIQDSHGVLELCLDQKSATAMFPDLSKYLMQCELADLLALSRLVGMECPGLYSLFSSIDVKFQNNLRQTIKFNVLNADKRFSMVKINVEGSSLTGIVNAFCRPCPQKQVSTYEVSKKVIQGEFADQTALIAGGSRGLGEITAKIIAAGGGKSIITYNIGANDAKQVATDIQKNGEKCHIFQYDILNPEGLIKELVKSKFDLTHIYYFASPRILKSTVYDEKLFKHFMEYYVDGFHKLYQLCRLHWHKQLSIFYPSTIAVDGKMRDLEEYSAAKAQGEALCRQLMNLDKYLNIMVKRLPRIATDQTLVLLPDPAADALEIILNVTRELRDSQIASG